MFCANVEGFYNYRYLDMFKFKNLKSFCGIKTLSTALGFEPRYFDCRSIN